MSGGSLDYAYGRLDDLACTIAARAKTPLHMAFAEHLRKVASAAHDLEWVWSCDTCPGDEEAAIRAVIAPGAELAEAVKAAETARKNLEQAIESAKTEKGGT